MAMSLDDLSASERTRFLALLRDQRSALSEESRTYRAHQFRPLGNGVVCSACDLHQANAGTPDSGCDGVRPAIGKSATQGARDWWAA